MFSVRSLFLRGALSSAVLLTSVSPAWSAPTSIPAEVAREVAYSQQVSWQVDGVPEIGAMEPTIRRILQETHVQYAGADGQPVAGFFPGANYVYMHMPGWTPFYVYARDTATILPMARYYFGLPQQRTAVEEFFRLQYPDGSVSATISPDYKVDKATVVSDEETSAILAAVSAYEVQPDPAWLTQPIRGQALVERMNRAMTWVLTDRRDPTTRLVKRAHTTDWGDVKWEVSDHPTDIQPGDQWTASIYDQAIAYAALSGLARLNQVAGKPAEAQRWQAEAATLRAASGTYLWLDEPERGYYRVHLHLEPNTIEHDFDEDAIVSIGNAAAVYYGLAEPARVPRILDALERARRQAGAAKPGLTLQPAYPGWQESQMDPRVYQNGAVWDWWGGRQITGEFVAGARRLAMQHLVELARDWASHPGQVREWESPWLKRTGRDQSYSGAAAVVGQAVVEGLFGVHIVGQEVQLFPRLGEFDGTVRVYQPANDVYAAYRYEFTRDSVTLVYGSNSPAALAVRLPILWPGEATAVLDGTDELGITLEQHGDDRVARVIVPSGTHQIELRTNRGG